MCCVATPDERPEVMTSAQAAELLQMNRIYLVTLARDGTIPGHRFGRHWRFLRSELLAWIAAQGPNGPADRTALKD